MTTISIIGAGSLGATLARELTARGIETRVISRGDARRELPNTVGHVRADATDVAALTAALQGSDIVMQASQPKYYRWVQEFPALQRGIIDATAAAGAKLVVADNLYMYGAGDHGRITDTTPELPCSAKGKVRKAMADEALASHREGRLQVALTRPSNYLGAEYEYTRSLLAEPARAGKPMSVFGRLDQPHSFSHLPDVARAMVDVALADDAYGRAWILPTIEAVTQRELCDAIWTAAGNDGEAKVRPLRGLGMRAIGLINPMVRASIEMMYEFENPYVVHATDFEARFGWAGTSLAEAIHETVAGAGAGQLA